MEKMPLELKRVVVGDNFLEGVLGALNEEANSSVEFQKSMTIKGGPPMFEKRRISRRLSEGDLGNVIKTPGLMESSISGSKFLFKYGQGSGNRFRLLNPIDFGAQKQINVAKSSGQSVSVLRAGLEEQEIEENEEEVVEIELKLKNEVQKGDITKQVKWKLNQAL
ncbi:hypothetical protein M0R45_030714 [Rubus argutus]|uniref:Uncharacterized protein n=1 Tax=Rubus argutus TaxID=59490 RepID=A0AAW1WE00_RUBAR